MGAVSGSRRRDLTRAGVIAAAAAIADEQGPEALTLAALAGRLGVKPPSLYNHVAGLDGLRRDLALLGLRDLDARLARAAVGKATDEAMAAMADAYRAFVQERPGLAAATVPSPSRDPDPALVEAARAATEVVTAVLAGYGLTGEDAVHAARAFRSAVHGFASLEAGGGFGLPVATDASFRWLVEALVADLRRRRRPA
jgi:AcrR family transcriptional regulator